MLILRSDLNTDEMPEVKLWRAKLKQLLGDMSNLGAAGKTGQIAFEAKRDLMDDQYLEVLCDMSGADFNAMRELVRSIDSGEVKLAFHADQMYMKGEIKSEKYKGLTKRGPYVKPRAVVQSHQVRYVKLESRVRA